MNRNNHNITLFYVLMMVVSGVLPGCGDRRRAESASPETLNGISVIVAQKTTVPDWLQVVGTVRATQTSQVSSQMMGTIIEIRAQDGDRVRRGQVLATIDDAQPGSAVNQALAALDAAREEVSAADSMLVLAGATLKRYQQLYDKKSVSPQEFDEVKARYQSAAARRAMAQAQQQQANAALVQARTTLGYTQIRAPFAGIVTEKSAQAGALASPGMPIFTIENTQNYRLEIPVDESDIRLIHAREPAAVTIDALGDRNLPGRVVQIVPAADPASRSFLVKIGLPVDGHLRSGLFGRAAFARGARPALLIPRAALVARGQLRGIYVVGTNQIAELRYVTLGNNVAEQVEVLSGLQAGEKLVAEPGDRDFSGKRIVSAP
ncbi:MAG: efflux RND transporter periplasmic adaptor subunit [Candidatus Acidiferrales bacterium]